MLSDLFKPNYENKAQTLPFSNTLAKYTKASIAEKDVGNSENASSNLRV